MIPAISLSHLIVFLPYLSLHNSLSYLQNASAAISHTYPLTNAFSCHVRVLDRNSAELNKLRSEYAGLMKELSDSNSKLQQEEHQRKSLEVSYKQNVSQLEVR